MPCAHSAETGRPPRFSRSGEGLQRRVGIDHAIGKALEQMSLGRPDAEMVELPLRLGPRHGGDAIESRRVAMLIGKIERFLPRARDHRPERHAHRLATGNSQPATQAKDRVEHASYGIGEGPPVRHTLRRTNALPPAHEGCAIRLELHVPARLAFDHHEVGRPDLGLFGRSAAPCRQKRASIGNKLGFHEQFGKRRVCRVLSIGTEDEFGIGGEFDFTRTSPEIGYRDSAYLGVVLGGDRDFERGPERTVMPNELRMVFKEGCLVMVRFAPRRLVARRPRFAAQAIAQENVTSPIIAGDVFAPARHIEIAPAAVTRARSRHHHRIAAVRQKMRARNSRMRRIEAPLHLGGDMLGLRGGPDFQCRRAGDRDVARHAFLKQKLGCLDDRVGVKTLAHLAFQKRIRDRHDAHGMVMRHIGAHDGDFGPFRKTRWCVVEGLVPAVRATASLFGQPLEIFRGSGRFNHCRKSRRVRCDDDVLAETALIAEVGDTKTGILIGAVHVARVEEGFRNAPWHAQLTAILDLSTDSEARGQIQNAPRRRPHHERRHQIFEHRTRP